MVTYKDPPFSCSSLHHMRQCIVEGAVSKVPNTIFFLEVLYFIHATIACGQNTQWRQLSQGGCAKKRILQTEGEEAVLERHVYFSRSHY